MRPRGAMCAASSYGTVRSSHSRGPERRRLAGSEGTGGVTRRGSAAPAATEESRLGAAVDVLLRDGPYRLSSLGGSGGRTFRARAKGRAVVVRLDVNEAVLRRLAEIAVGPRVIAAGELDGRGFVVQEYAAARPADAGWLAAHADHVAALVMRYQSDGQLALLAGSELTAPSYASSLLAAAERLSAEPGATIVAMAARLAVLAGDLPVSTAVSTHGDPNSENILTGPRPLLVDWDDLRLADPMRDIGQLAWWYLPEAAWPGFLAATGQAFAEPALDRLYWWVAAESLDVGLRLVAEDAALATAFFEDARAALGRQPNPRRAT